MHLLMSWVTAVSLLARVEDATARLSVANQFRLNQLWRWHQEHQCPQVRTIHEVHHDLKLELGTPNILKLRVC
jgi:hypothetical protein